MDRRATHYVTRPLPTFSTHWRDSLVVLLAHGSETTPEGVEFVLRQAAALRQLGMFADVQAAFLRDIPHPRDLVAKTRHQVIYVVPFMVSDGYAIDVMIPKAMNLDGPLTEIDTSTGRKTVHLCRPVGTHSAIREQSLEFIQAIKSAHGLGTSDTSALVLCHGTPRHQGGRKYGEQVLRGIQNSGLVAHAAILFLEEPPKIDEWRSCVPSRYVIAMPYLMTAGRHGSFDIPELLGIDADTPEFRASVREGRTAGPYDVSGRMMWYTPLVGSFDSIPDIVIDRIAGYDKANASGAAD